MKIPFYCIIGLLSLSIYQPVRAQVLASIGNTKITLQEFNQKYEKVTESSLYPPTKELLLEDLVRLEVGLQEAEKQKIKSDPVVIERYNQLVYAAFIEKAIGKTVEAIKITENDMKKYYNTSPELRTNHILIQLPQNATKAQIAETKARAQKILAEVKASKKSFAELVAIYSDDLSTKKNGGDIGWQSRLTITPEYYQAARKLSKGKMSGLVQTNFGFHIIKLVDENPFEKANKRHLRQVVFDQKRAEVFNKYFEKLKTKYKISINKSLLK